MKDNFFKKGEENRMKKSIKYLLTVLLFVSLILGACGNDGEKDSEKKESDFKVGMVTDLGSVNDKSFNQSAWEGLQKLEEDLGFEVKYLEPKSDDEVLPNLLEFVKNGYDLTWATAATLEDAITELANDNPDAKLGIVDSDLTLPNVVSVSFKEQEGAFLVGVIAGLTTETNKIGFVGGMDIPVIKRFEAGFREGIKAVNPEASLAVNYTGEFSRVDMGKSAASTMYNDGVDIIFHASGLTGNGVFNEATERFESGQNVWVIGVDKDQSVTFGNDVTLTSMIKKVDEAVYDVSKRLSEDELSIGEHIEMGLAEDGLDIAPNSEINVDADILKIVEEYREKIISGEIVVPTE